VRRSYVAGGAVAAGAVIALVVGVLAHAHKDEPAQAKPRAQTFIDYTACLLTDSSGLTGPAAAIWDGMHDASASTHARVQYLSLAGAQTAANAQPYLAGLAQSKCAVIYATGAGPSVAVKAVAGRFPHVRFAVLLPALTSGNVTSLPRASSGDLRAAARKLLVDAARSR
jgi:basic membrane lipoprotein Med (substrate-binding protein (PBP1-ABC) superfamily)